MNRKSELAQRLAENGQEHVLHFWPSLSQQERKSLESQIARIPFPLVNRLVERWLLNEPRREHFARVEPIKTIPAVNPRRPDAREARDAGEEVLRRGQVGLLLVAGGRGSRLGFPEPKGAYPIGPVSRKSLFAYHAEKIHNLRHRYACVLPWYIMVSPSNAEPTHAFFEANDFFGLERRNVRFFCQGAMPCVDKSGKFLLEAPHRIAMNPNGHGGCIPALAEEGVLAECEERGVNLLSYFQVDNWAVQVADPYFIGYHVLRQAQMSSKVHRRHDPLEPVGVHCLCDGQYRVIEYTAFDVYPQLLELTSDGTPKYYPGNSAIHILTTSFIAKMYRNYHQFPWWRALRKIPYVNEKGRQVVPTEPNGYKFETYVFDALRFIEHQPVALDIKREGEYTPIKHLNGPNSVTAARNSMRAYWAKWLEGAGFPIPRDKTGQPTIQLEISPRFALTQEEFLEKARTCHWPTDRDLVIGPDGKPQGPV